MFKIVALVGLLAGGAGYAAYEYTDLFGCKGQTCSLSNNQQAAKPSCCDPGADCCEAGAACCDSAKAAAKPAACCQTGDECCEVRAACCSAPSRTVAVSAKKAACCANPCAACADGCDGCPICEIDCSGCCGAESAKIAVGGPAALAKPVK
jgi:hypothetical protein